MEERESRDFEGEDAAEEGDGVRGDELAERDEESDLDGNTARDGRKTRLYPLVLQRFWGTRRKQGSIERYSHTSSSLVE